MSTQSEFDGIKSKPTWDIFPNQDLSGSGGSADIVLAYLDGIYNPAGKTALVLDAKYYHLKKAIEDCSVKDLPKLNDVRKQYFYADFLRKINNIKSTRNAFIFPIETFDLAFTFKRYGSVSFSNYIPITVIGVNLVWLMKSYTNSRSHISIKILNELFLLTEESEQTSTANQ